MCKLSSRREAIHSLNVCQNPLQPAEALRDHQPHVFKASLPLILRLETINYEMRLRESQINRGSRDDLSLPVGCRVT